MDYELAETDLYTLNREKLITLAQKYNIKIDNDTTIRELRPTCASLKHHLLKAKDDEYYEQILSFVITSGVIHPNLLNKYPRLDDLQHFFNDVPEEDQKGLLDKQKQLYDSIVTQKRTFTINTAQFPLQLQNTQFTIQKTLQQSTQKPLLDNPNTSVHQDKAMTTKVKIPLLTPTQFSGLPSKNIQSFLDRFKLCAEINNWNEVLQKQHRRIY